MYGVYLLFVPGRARSAAANIETRVAHDETAGFGVGQGVRAGDGGRRAGPGVGAGQSGGVSDKPDTPFKLATFEAQNKVRLGMVLGDTVLDISGANQQLTKQAKLATVAIPAEMRALIEEYDRVKPRLYQIANYFKAANLDKATFAFAVASVSFKAPIKYPWNLLAAAANSKAHAAGNGRHPGRHCTGAGGRCNGRRAARPAAAGCGCGCGRIRPHRRLARRA